MKLKKYRGLLALVLSIITIFSFIGVLKSYEVGIFKELGDWYDWLQMTVLIVGLILIGIFLYFYYKNKEGNEK